MNIAISKQIGSFAVVAIVLAIAFILWSNNIFAGSPPTNLGVNNGKLATCPTTPNCVSSQAPSSDTQHAIAPLAMSGDVPTTMATLKTVIQAMPRTNIVKETTNYLYVEFASKLMRFVDDVEFYLDDDPKMIQVRSASRLGESDLGVNRQRIEEIRSKLAG
ncbi:DUF1499 domain-containing protein [Chamaesiphon sp.]|uniref:DUF1499 domain-containing protein n=1 Tax=Chamaesiphon sp. TaxID=2814140 RepID=UPI003593E978